MIRISKIAILISTLVLLNFSVDKQVNCLCTNLLQCLAMGAEVIKPRFITNLQGFNDRNYYKDEYKSDANIKVSTMNLIKENLLEEDELKKEIHKLTLVEKIRQIAQLKKKTKDIQHSHK
jgi:hypothetical protein